MALYRLRPLAKCAKPTITTVLKLNYSAQTVVESQPSKRTKMENKVAVVTGGGAGIGYAIAKSFLEEGGSAVTIVDNDKAKAQKNVQKLADEFGEDKVLFMEADVGNSKQMDLAFKNTVFHYDTIDIIVNNAGVMDDTHWETQIKTNLHGCVIGTLLGMQYMARSSSGEGGIIVNIGSVISVVPSSGFPIYTMTQFGISGKYLGQLQSLLFISADQPKEEGNVYFGDSTLNLNNRREGKSFTNALGSSSLYQRTGVKIFGYCPGLTDTRMTKDVTSACINENFAKEFREEIEGCTFQKPESVANGLIGILDDARPGSMWVIENNTKPYEIKFPNVSNEKKTLGYF